MLFSDEYKTIEGLAQGQFRDKGSRFLAFAIPVNNEKEVKTQLESLRKQYYDATHHCYAWMLGFDKSAYRVNDDGEPSGTAGRPIYGQILSHDLTNILIVVIRYYGGTKLGVPGLINAYKMAAIEALFTSVAVFHFNTMVFPLGCAVKLTNSTGKSDPEPLAPKVSFCVDDKLWDTVPNTRKSNFIVSPFVLNVIFFTLSIKLFCSEPPLKRTFRYVCALS